MVGKEKEQQKSTYVKLENANLTKLSLRRMSVFYTDYANIVIEINKLHKEKELLKVKVYKDLTRIKEEFRKLYDSLPKEAQRRMQAPAVKKVEVTPAEREFELETGLESFEALKKEFERIRTQLEHIK